MRKLKVVIVACALFVLGFVVFYSVKQPTYSIKTEGILYIVNKVSKSVTIFELNEGQEIKELPIAVEPHEAAFVKNLNRLVVTNYGSSNENSNNLTVINPKDNKVIHEIALGKSSKPHGIIPLKAPNKVAVVTDIGNDLSIVNIATGKLEKQIATQQEFSHLLVEHPKKPLVYVSNINSGSVSVIDIQLDSVVKVIPFSNKVEGIDISADGTELWVTNIKENLVYVVNTETNKTLTTLSTGKEPLRLKFSNDDKYCLVSNASDGTVSVYDSKSKKEIATIHIPGKKNILEKILYHTPRPVGILMHPNGQYAFVSNFTAGRVEVIDLNSFTIVSSIKVGQMPDGLALIN
ncbi:beta-propeller fold lactonase family protein [Polaribacter sp. R77954]|uniref:beta-propeller fold lactonase family protein n=1 Tax=Polaribacter sp. R77954 TaxID=3093870 RepID=UPI0037C8F089